jgi:hypothetical protein
MSTHESSSALIDTILSTLYIAGVAAKLPF